MHTIIRELRPISRSATPRLPDTTYATITSLGLSVTRPILRGKRGGTRIQRAIESRITTTRTVSVNAITTTTIDRKDNLITVPLENFSSTGVPRNNFKRRIAVSTVNLGLVNARSIRNKTYLLIDSVIDAEIDLLAITETWLCPGESDTNTIKDVKPAGYTFDHVPRKNRRGGGIGFLYRSIFTVTVSNKQAMSPFEFMDIDVSSHNTYIKLVIVYRPPPSNKNKLTFADVIREFTPFIEHYAMSSSRFAILGDFNIHWDKPSDSHVKRFMELIDSLNIIQHVQEPTHIDGHIIDLIFTRADNHGITSTRTSSLLSDHVWINSVVDLVKPSVPTKSIEYRKYRSIDKAAFRDDIAASELVLLLLLPVTQPSSSTNTMQSFQLLLTNMRHCSRVE